MTESLHITIRRDDREPDGVPTLQCERCHRVCLMATPELKEDIDMDRVWLRIIAKHSNCHP
jgi:hypothetical protein